MKRKFIIGALLCLAMACKKEQDNTAGKLPTREESTTAVAVKTLQRLEMKSAQEASNSGPAASSESTNTSQLAATSSIVPFIPNAGVIWRDPNNGQTHLLALQLPGTPGKQVQWESLGTGWEGTQSMAMDNDYFYAVWKNNVYRINKRSPNAWKLLIANNGQHIAGIVGNKQGGFLARGGRLYKFSPSGALMAMVTAPFANLSNTRLMSGYRESNGDYRIYFLDYDWRVLQFHYETDGSYWTNYPYPLPNFYQNMAANPMTKRLYLANGETNRHIDMIDEWIQMYGFSSQPFSGHARLVVNNGYLWVMGNNLQQLMTLGSQAGKPAYTEYGWTGIMNACADPGMVFY